ncbi:MAG TPA: C69 family dipeptidase [Roseiflexaceae bacterium]|nr:C69 family dipeptidase [Roseiflexaceae bacterium]
MIGNEAIFTKTFRAGVESYRQGRGPELGLLGMDLVRLALERCRSARQATELIGDLVEQYGQFGSGVPASDHAQGGYDNSFIIADPSEAWVLEAVGTRWAAKRISGAYASISNQPSIRTTWDLGSPDLAAYATEQGWWPADTKSSFDFSRAYIDQNVARQLSHIRARRSEQLLAEQNGRVTIPWMMRIARDHYEDTFLHGPYFDAADPDFLSLCMHVSPAQFTWGNTASSCIAALPNGRQQLPVFWWTPGPPCNGCYVPFFVHGSVLPEIVSRAGTFGKRVVRPDRAHEDGFAADSYWWLFRRLMDAVKGDPVRSLPDYYVSRNRLVREHFDPIEQAFMAEAPEVVEKAGGLIKTDRAAAMDLLDAFTGRCLQTTVTALKTLLAIFDNEG